MVDEREELTLRELSRWLVLAAFLLTGVGLYFGIGLDTPPVVPAAALEVGP